MSHNKILNEATSALQGLKLTKIKGHKASIEKVQDIMSHLFKVNDALISIFQLTDKLPCLNSLCEFEYHLSKIHKHVTNISPKTLNLGALFEITTALVNEMAPYQLSHHLTALVNFVDYNDISTFQTNSILNPILEKIIASKMESHTTIPIIYQLIKLDYFMRDSFDDTENSRENVLKHLISQLPHISFPFLSKHEIQQLKLSCYSYPKLFDKILSEKIIAIPYTLSAGDVTTSHSQEIFFSEVKAIFPSAKSEYFIPELGKTVDAFIGAHNLIIEFDGPTHLYKMGNNISHKRSDFFYDIVARKHKYEILRVCYNEEESLFEIIIKKFPKIAKSLNKSIKILSQSYNLLDFKNSDSSSEDEVEVEMPESALAQTATTTTTTTSAYQTSLPKADKKLKLKKTNATKQNLSPAKNLDEAIGRIIEGEGNKKQKVANINTLLEVIIDPVDLNAFPFLALRFISLGDKTLLTNFLSTISGPITNLKELVPMLTQNSAYPEGIVKNKLLSSKCSISNLKTYLGTQIKTLKNDVIYSLIEKLCYFNFNSWTDIIFLDKYNYPKPGMFKSILAEHAPGKIITPLVTCLSLNTKNLDLLNYLLKNGANIDAFMKIGEASYTALMALTTIHDVPDKEAKVELLLKYEPNVSYPGIGGISILATAIARNSSEKIIKLLLDNGADPNSVNSEEESVLGMAIANNCSLKIIKLLLDYGADPFYINPKINASPITYAQNRLGPKGLLEFFTQYIKDKILSEQEIMPQINEADNLEPVPIVENSQNTTASGDETLKEEGVSLETVEEVINPLGEGSPDLF